MSVDLVGSTALKQRSAMAAGDLEPWLPWFQGFYEALLPFLHAQYDQLPEPLRKDAAQLPVLWKYNGDEILLRTSLANHREALTHVVALKQAVCTWRTQWAEGLSTDTVPEDLRKRRFPLDVKATAWLAGFPVSNAVVGDDPENPADLIGPQVDLGFRLAKMASRTHLVMDAGLAYMVAEAMGGTNGLTACCFRYLKRHEFKGILEGLPYPVLAIHAEHELVNAEEALGQAEAPQATALPPDKVIAFCEHFHKDTLGVVRPFIFSDPGIKFAIQPKCHEALEARRQRLIDLRTKQGYVPPQAQDNPPEGESPQEVTDDVEVLAEGTVVPTVAERAATPPLSEER
ncbi:MAG: hypothetical protein IT204_05020 [Fimbriimonadaceae bacterium]|nr:hypothetical protein [Fimbriimonadaceae bacterium]